MTELELLAPARNLACGIAAVDHGADAVYIGASQFGARASAGNSLEDIRQLCRYAHQYGVKVYVTVNTIVYDYELSAIERLIFDLYDADVDAILVQDMGILKMNLPPIALHASTQTDNRTADKVQWLGSLGFSRVVLARELSADEIAAIHAQVPDVQLEVFVHGALCVSYSGLCYASQHCFGRSANRGTCAQFCRMKFDLIDADGQMIEEQRHLLSLKDLNQSEHLEQLILAGATSFKIEGRLKELSYVKNVVAAYSQQLDAFIRRHPDQYSRASKGYVTYTFKPHLEKTFNRGFTTYFLNGRQPDIFSPDTSKAMGEYVGRVKDLRRDSFRVSGTASFANGDGLCFLHADHVLEGFRVNRVEGNRLFPQQMPPHLRPGIALYRNHDQEFQRLLSRPSAERRIPISMMLKPTPDGFSLTSEQVTVRLSCEHQVAKKPQREHIVRQLTKLGGTPYACSHVIMADGFNYFIPSSLLADLRRQLVAALINQSLTHQKNSDRCHQVSTLKKNDAICTLPSALENNSALCTLHSALEVNSALCTLHSALEVSSAHKYPYFYNIANRLACQFYGVPEASAYELKGGQGPVMQCRHCLRYALGYCVRHGGRKPQWREPLRLRLGDGRLFPLAFDCQHCQMNVYAQD